MFYLFRILLLRIRKIQNQQRRGVDLRLGHSEQPIRKMGRKVRTSQLTTQPKVNMIKNPRESIILSGKIIRGKIDGTTLMILKPI